MRTLLVELAIRNVVAQFNLTAEISEQFGIAIIYRKFVILGPRKRPLTLLGILLGSEYSRIGCSNSLENTESVSVLPSS